MAVKVGDLIKNKRHPQAGTGIVVEVGSPGGYDHDLEPDYVIALWPNDGMEVAYADEIEVISEGG